MRNGIRIGCHAAAAAALAVARSALAQEPTRDDLLSEVERLRARVEALEQRSGPDARIVDQTVERMIRDAQQRSQLLAAEGFTAGYDKGFFIRSADGNFVLRPSFQLQFRHVTTFRDDVGADDDNGDVESGFEIRRLKFAFEGNAFTPDLTYYFQWATDRNGGDVALDDAFVRYQYAPVWAFKAGQYKAPFFKEELTGDKYLMTVERSLLNQLLGGGLVERVQGVSLIYGNADTPLHGELMFNDGARSLNTPFTDSPGSLGGEVDEHFGATGRVEYKLAGDWKDYRDFTAREAKDDLLIVGAAVNFTQAENVDAYFATADVLYKNPNGLSLFGAVVGDWLLTRNVATDDAFNWGFQAQAGYMLNPAWELFAAFDMSLFDDDVAIPGGGFEDTFPEIVAGVNWYLGPDGSYGHRAKVQLDVVFLPNGAPRDVTGNGILASEENEFVIRGQFQLLL